jgi:predicted DNA binding CopG/RHH family protein
MKNIVLDKEEKELTKSIDRDEWKEMKGEKTDKLKTLIRKAAFSKKKERSRLTNQRVTLNLFSSDIPIIREKAEQEGLGGYQVLIRQLVHKYATGQIKLK